MNEQVDQTPKDNRVDAAEVPAFLKRTDGTAPKEALVQTTADKAGVDESPRPL